jgi:hypothetical protein
MSSIHSPSAIWTHSAIFLAFLAEFNSRLTAHLGLRNSTADSESESHVMTDGQSASRSWNKATIWALRPDYCQKVAGLFMLGALSDERRVYRLQLLLSLASAVILASVSRGTRDQISDLRLSFSSPPTTRSTTVEAFCWFWVWVWVWFSTELFFIDTSHGPNRTYRSQHFLYCCLRIRCHGKLFTKPLLAMDFSSGSTIPAFRRHVTMPKDRTASISYNLLVLLVTTC